jgi:hypothetical protein
MGDQYRRAPLAEIMERGMEEPHMHSADLCEEESLDREV